MPFRYCLNTSTIKPVPTILEKIRIAGAAGYDAVELWCDDITAHAQGGGTLRDIRLALDDAGLERPDLVHFPRWMDADETTWREKLAEARTKMEQGAAIGAPRIIAGPSWSENPDYDLDAERYSKIMELGQKIGCLPALEYLSICPKMTTLASLLEVARRANHPDTKVIVDSFHIWNGGGSVDDIDLLSAGQIQIFHINDAPRGAEAGKLADADRVMPGEGMLPLRAMLDKLRAKGWSGFLSLELFNAEYWKEDPLALARRGLEAVKEIAEL
ncbi:MAG: sugar phosphate isomerase/epimerase [Candidatus Sumerlaeota bacterium]|nr:sugar phosphate isomerase/epimerase [Candidatus Sumerlaeota bacterium]